MKKQWKKGWKVITNRRKSIVLLFESQGCRTYPSNKKVKRQCRCGPLAVFTTIKDAERFYSIYNNKGVLDGEVLLVSCKYLPSKDKELWFRNSWFDKPTITTKSDVPAGTDFADAVICLE